MKTTCRICGCDYVVVSKRTDNIVCPLCHKEPKDNRVHGGDIVCEDCAKKLKWTWPEGHMATFWMGKCDFCNTVKSVCSARDWRH